MGAQEKHPHIDDGPEAQLAEPLAELAELTAVAFPDYERQGYI